MRTLLRFFLLLAFAVVLGGFSATATLAQVASGYANGWIGSPTSGPTPGADWTPLPPNPNPTGPPDANCIGTSNAQVVWAQFSYAGLGIPGGSVIEGIEVNVNYTSVVAPSMQLYLSGSPVGSTRTLPAAPPAGVGCASSSLRTAGGPMDLWGTSLTAANFNSGNIAVRLTRTTAGPDNPVSIDIESVQLVVYYDDGSNNDPDCSGGTIATQNANASCQASITGANVTGVTDPDGDGLTITVSPMTLALGSNSVTINADDGNGGTCSKMVNVTVVDVTDPVITCPANATLNANASCQATYSGPPATATDNCSVSVTSAPPLPAGFTGLGGNVIAYTATDGSGNDVSCNQTVTVQDVTPPVITLNGANPQTLECALSTYNELGATVTDNCDASPSLVINADAVDVSMTGSYPVTYDATDASGNPATQKTRTVNVEDTTPPDITCPDDATLFADAVCQATYTGPPATAVDACDASPTVSSLPPLPATFTGVSDNPIDYTATDADGNASMCTQTVSVEDITPPTITLVAGPIELWPPNHNYHTIDLDDLITAVADNCDAMTADNVVTADASSDEPENAVGGGDGNTTDDIVHAADCRAVDLRAERQGGGNGRVYTLDLEASDKSMNVGTASFEVHVAHSKKSGAVDDGPAYNVPGTCPLPLPLLAATPTTEAGALTDASDRGSAAHEARKEAEGEKKDAAEAHLDAAPGQQHSLAAEEAPTTFMLEAAYPNPFNPQTQIRFGLPETAEVTLAVFDALGREVARLVEGSLSAGRHEVTFEAQDLPSGLYIYRLTTPEGGFTRTMLLMK